MEGGSHHLKSDVCVTHIECQSLYPWHSVGQTLKIQ